MLQFTSCRLTQRDGRDITEILLELNG